MQMSCKQKKNLSAFKMAASADRKAVIKNADMSEDMQVCSAWTVHILVADLDVWYCGNLVVLLSYGEILVV